MISLNVLHHTSDNRGDHAADVAIAYDVHPNETVGEIVARIGLAHPDHIEIRVPR